MNSGAVTWLWSGTRGGNSSALQQREAISCVWIDCNKHKCPLTAGVHQNSVLPASLVRTPLEGALGSPVPIALMATTRNSYSTQGLSSTAMADSMSPVTGSGSADKSVSCVFMYSEQASYCSYSTEDNIGKRPKYQLRALKEPDSVQMHTEHINKVLRLTTKTTYDNKCSALCSLHCSMFMWWRYSFLKHWNWSSGFIWKEKSSTQGSWFQSSSAASAEQKDVIKLQAKKKILWMYLE